MWEFLKSAEAIEKELRNWKFEDCMRVMPPSESEEWREYYRTMDIQQLVAEVVGNCVNGLLMGGLMRGLNGSEFDSGHLLKGQTLAESLAKKKGWTLTISTTHTPIHR
jgi:hypothetical protein